MALESIVGKEKKLASQSRAYTVSALASKETHYSLFSEQYLEQPVVSGDYKLTLTPTICTFKGIPTIDDW